MKKELTILFLNVHGGITLQPLKKYLEKMSSAVDIFCFQEVPSSPFENWSPPHPNGATPDLYQQLERVLPEFQGYYLPCQSNRHMQDPRLAHQFSFGLATFVAREFSNVQISSRRIYQPEREYGIEQHGTVPRDILCAVISSKEKGIGIANVHGLWDPQGKIDTPERVSQSYAIHDAIKQFPVGFVVGGDFNLLPDADSLTVFERRFEMRDLIKEYGISNTRSITQYKKECRFADYVFVNKNREVRTFSVDETADDVSDHLPLIVTVSI